MELGAGDGRGAANRRAVVNRLESLVPRSPLSSLSTTTVVERIRSPVRMASGRVRGGYPRVSGFRVSGSVFGFYPRICGFGYPKYFGFGADL